MRIRRFIEIYLAGTLGSTPLLFYYGAADWVALLWLWAGFFFYLPAVIPNNGWFGPMIRRFVTPRREVWLTLDDGPDPIDTPLILDLLDQYQARATFFLIGERALRHPEWVREIVRRGHTLGNHTLTHPVASFWMAGPWRLQKEIGGCAKILRALVPEKAPSLFRAPVGMANLFLAPLLRAENLQLIGWSSRGFDAVEADPVKVVDRIWRDVRPGAIILLHQGHHSVAGVPLSPRCLELVLQRLHQADYRAVIPTKDAWI